MPLYEYLCGSCGHRFERIQKFSDAPITECPSCGGAVEKQISSPAIQFKGSGWYINDYARAGKSEAKPDSAPKEGAAAEGKTDKAEGTATDKPAGEPKVDKTATEPAAKPAAKPATSSADKA